jgi:hypothetical protein
MMRCLRLVAALLHNALGVQFHVGQGLEPASARQGQREAYDAIGVLLGQSSKLSHSLQILDYVAHSASPPELGTAGCLYLPSNDAWRSFYEYVEHPYAPLFAELIANAYDPGCNRSGTANLKTRWQTAAECPEGHVRGRDWQVVGKDLANLRSRPSDGSCVGATHEGFAGGIQVFETAGHVGLPWKWQSHISRVAQGNKSSIRRLRSRGKIPESTLCDNANRLPKAPEDKRLLIPTRFIICCTDAHKCPLDREMVEDQVSWMNTAYAGKEPWTLEYSDFGVVPPHVDMQVQFELVNVSYVHDPGCARDMFTEPHLASRHNTHGEGMLTYIISTDDQSGILGMAEFPTRVPESSQELSVNINLEALRRFSSKTGLKDLTYDEGDTCIHEGGHSLGLLHTFEGGCSHGDKVDDTAPEEFPSYSCTDGRTCHSPDPIHNFMDYAPDSCMSGFTEQQKRRMWCVIRHHRPVMYKTALRSA